MSLRSALPPILLLFALAAGPLACGPIPGGSLSGNESDFPDDWTPHLDEGRAFCEIESRASDPHSIQLDCFLYEGALHVQSHRWALASWWPTESWASIWIQEPLVRLRVGQQIFDATAELVSTPVDRIPVLELRGYDPVPDGIAVFRFVPRDE